MQHEHVHWFIAIDSYRQLTSRPQNLGLGFSAPMASERGQQMPAPRFGRNEPPSPFLRCGSAW